MARSVGNVGAILLAGSFTTAAETKKRRNERRFFSLYSLDKGPAHDRPPITKGSRVNHTTPPKSSPTTPVVERIAGQGGRFAKFYPAWIPLIPTWRPLVVFLVLLSHADMNGHCCLMRATIAREAHIDIRHVSRAIRFLESIEAVKTFPVLGRASRYQVSFQPPLAVLAKGQLLAEMAKTPLAVLAKTPLAEMAHHNRPREESFLKETSRGRAHDDGAKAQTTDEQANDLADEALEETRGLTTAQRQARIDQFRAMIRAKHHTKSPTEE